ncbi:hypothetical protein ANCDUO_07958, partial [Ancylostoma duodenale]
MECGTETVISNKKEFFSRERRERNNAEDAAELVARTGNKAQMAGNRLREREKEPTNPDSNQLNNAVYCQQWWIYSWFRAVPIIQQDFSQRMFCREDAEMEYLRVAQDLEMYGILYYPIC